MAEIKLVGLVEIAELLGVRQQTAQVWRTRGVMPEPDFTVSGTPVWHRQSIVRWARQTGRLTADGPQKLSTGAKLSKTGRPGRPAT